MRGVALAALAAGLAFSVGCGSSGPSREIFEIPSRSPERLARIQQRLEARDATPVESLATVSTPGRAHRRRAVKAFASSSEAIANDADGVGLSWEAEAAVDRDVAIAAVVAACQGKLCGGAARGSLLVDLPDRPSWWLRWLTGSSHPPLAGYAGARIRTNVFGLLWRLWFEKQYYAHLYKDNQGPRDSTLPNEVKVLVLRDQDGDWFYWVKTDAIGAFQDVRAAVIAELAARGIPAVGDSTFLIHGTHTHSGWGATNPRWLAQIATVDLFVESVFSAMVERIADTVEDAVGGLVPVKLGVGTGSISTITANRRADKHCGADPPDPDPDFEVGVVAVDDLTGAPLATVFNFAVHGTSYPDTNRRSSPDNMGFAEREVEKLVGGMALFFNGAEGDVKPKQPAGALDAAQWVGEALGTEVASARQAIGTSEVVDLRSDFCQLDDPLTPWTSARPCEDALGARINLEPFQMRPFKFVEDPTRPGCFLDRGPGAPLWKIEVPKADDPPYVEREGVVLSAFRIDVTEGGSTTSSVFLSLPGEAITSIGTAIKQQARNADGFDHAFVFGLSNAHLGYIVDAEEYRQGGYEAGGNLFGPTEGEVLSSIAAVLSSALAP